MSHCPRGVVALSLILALASSASAATFLINSPGDLPDTNPGDGTCSTGGIVFTGGTPSIVLECTLRAAIQEANALPGGDTLNFASYIATGGGGFVHITPGSALPVLNGPLILDGYTAPGYDTGDPEQHPIVRIDGSSAGVLTSGLVVTGGGTAIRGVAVHGFSGNGISLVSGSSVVQGCYVGLFNFGAVDGNAGDGIQVGANATGSTIGQTCGPEPQGCTGRGNVVSGNGAHGVDVQGRLVVIAGNRIGTRADGNGTVAFLIPTGNAGFGIRVQRPAPQETLIGDVGFGPGGVVVPAGNLVSGNRTGGIRVESDQNLLRANLVGTRIDGSGNAGNEGPGIDIRVGSDNVVGDVSGDTHNVIGWNEGSGIVIGAAGSSGTDDNLVVNNFIGTDAGASLPLPNDEDGVELRSGFGSRIEGNTIAANVGSGIRGVGGDTEVVGNRIGVTAAGTCLGHGGAGVMVEGVDWQVGSPAPGEGNVIGCNLGGGVAVLGTGARVQSNHVGTDTLGNDLRNSGNFGIALGFVGAESGLIGGSMSAGEGNVIGFNAAGIYVQDFPSLLQGIEIYGNHIGTNPGGDPLGNNLGVFIENSTNVVVGDPSTPDRRNVIAHNTSRGVYLLGSFATSNPIRGNAIHDNGVLGIDLDPLGANPNDSGDTDNGPNNLQNWPVLDPALTLYDPVGDLVTLRYHVDSVVTSSSYPLAIDFYVADASGQGETWIGEALYTDPALTPVVSFTPAPGANLVGATLVATATDEAGDGSTSEFSSPVLLPEPGIAWGFGAGSLLLGTLKARRRRAKRRGVGCP